MPPPRNKPLKPVIRPGELPPHMVHPFFIARAEPAGTVIALIGLIITSVMLRGEVSSDVGRSAAIGSGIAILVSLIIDTKRGFKNLIRADVMAILALYFLTLFEFLFPQRAFDVMLSVPVTQKAIIACLVGMAGLLIGRHLLKAKQTPFEHVLTRPVPGRTLLTIFWTAFFVGYLHMLIAVNFNVIEMVGYFIEPRFTQPWTRGRLGDWKALIVELGLFIYLIPPMAGIIFARRQRFRKDSLILVAGGLLFTLFYGFSAGTRNVFASYLVTFLIAYEFSRPPGHKKEFIIVSSACAAVMLLATYFMLEFRTVGLREYVQNGSGKEGTTEKTLFVDYNLYAIGRLMEVFPARKEYLGLEVPYLAIIRPIPRALWPGKPEGLSTSIEEALDVQNLTIATSFIGEAYMAGGMLVVFVTGLFFGAVTGWWSYLASPKSSELGVLVYASGFFASVISMRSVFVFTTALLPTAASLFIATYVVRKVAERRRWRSAMAVQIMEPPRRPLARQPFRRS